MMREENHIFQGMKRDNHQIRQKSEFLWDAHNIRITNRDDSTLLSITNERGTSDELATFQGYYVGHCVLGKYLIVFTATTDSKGDSTSTYIYRIQKTDSGYDSVILYQDEGQLNLSPNNPIEALGVYENELIQKVYWIDGKNQPRVISIVKDNQTYNANSFDFVQTLKLQEEVRVSKIYGEGMFSPGTIQYALSYYNKYGQESNIFYTTPLSYISPYDRGGNPEERIANSFKVEVYSVDVNFDYLRIYSIHRTSLDAVPTVKRVIDIPIDKEELQTQDNQPLVYTDTGTSGEIVDPSMLIYVGGREIVASTMCSKDGTLFLGDIELKEGSDWLEIKKEVQNKIGPEEWQVIESRINTQKSGNGEYYSYEIGLDNTGFKTGETYRRGIQFQYKTGSWSEPVFLGDDILNAEYPYSNDLSSIWHSYRIKLKPELITYLKSKGYIKARACVVFPSIVDRTVLCQGVLCPTVYSVNSRSSNSPYAMASWFFRPQIDSTYIDNANNVYKGASIQYQHNRPLYTGPNRGAEIQSTPYDPDIKTVQDIKSEVTQSGYFFVDSNLVTMHSPEVEFDTSVQNLVLDDSLELKVLGSVQLGASIGDIDIQTSSPVLHAKASGFTHKFIGYQVGDNKGIGINGGLVSGLFYQDSLVKDNGDAVGTPTYHLIYPWHRSGSLNNSNQPSDTDKTRSSVISKKKISNLKFFNKFKATENELTYSIGTPQLFMSNELSIVKVWINYLNKSVPYFGNVDTMVTASNDGYDLYTAASFSGAMDSIPEGNDVTTKSSDPVRMKYKSTPHLVFSLKSSAPRGIEILPGMSGHTINGESYEIPDWDNTTGAEDNDSAVEGDYPELCRIECYYHTNFSSANSSEVGKFGWHKKLGTAGAVKTFQKAVKVGTSTASTGWDYLAAKEELKEGTIFKVVGDGQSCLLRDTFGTFGFGPSGSKLELYTGPTKYFKLTNAEYPTDDSYNRTIRGDLVEISTPSKVVENKEELEGSAFTITQKILNDSEFSPFLVLAELRRKNVTNRFGGSSESALRSNLWLPAGDPVLLDNISDSVGVDFKYGDTWYSRYDCLKTYPFTQEDENSVIEIGSFMCETRINIDGRYDKNRGQISNLNMSPTNFNLINDIYTQRDNFFNYRIYDSEYYENSRFANQVTWSTEKAAASDTDPWTNITLANTLDMYGEKGRVTALKAWNEYLVCFQERAFSQILFNSRVQISTTDGVPIEVSNGYKVDGSRLISGNIGCSDKQAITSTANGLYFLDSNTDGLYMFNGQTNNLTDSNGMTWWTRKHHNQSIKLFNDSIYGDVYLVPSNEEYALCFSEKLGQFTSQMSYGRVPAMFNYLDGFYSLNNDLKLYRNNAGDYNNFYGRTKGWDFSFISNDNPTYTKVFDTIEARADSYDKANEEYKLTEGDFTMRDKDRNTYIKPFSFIEVSNEYQESKADFNDSTLRKKFRIWRGTIPRAIGTRQRIVNPWTMITLGCTSQEAGNRKTMVHDVSVKYSI